MKYNTVIRKAAATAVQFKGEKNWKDVRDFVGSDNFYSYDPVRQLVLIGPEGKDRVTPGDWVVKETNRATKTETVYVVVEAEFKHEFEVTGERDTDKEEKAERDRLAKLEEEAKKKEVEDAKKAEEPRK